MFIYPAFFIQMGLILSIETATSVCSVAIGRDGELLALKEIHEGFSHAEKLTRCIETVCEEASVLLADLDAVAVSSGPGSYTGLRIGVSTAKGLCFALDLPLISVPTLYGIAFGLRKKLVKENANVLSTKESKRKIYLIPMIDARRMEVYTSLYDIHLNVLSATHAEIIDEASFSELRADGHVFFAGDGAVKLDQIFGDSEKVSIHADVLPSAAFFVAEAERKLVNGETENTSIFEPFYLKEYIPGKSKGQ